MPQVEMGPDPVLMAREAMDRNGAVLDGWSDRLQSFLRDWVTEGGRRARTAKDMLNGVWLGHPLHPALTDVPVGAWTSGVIMDFAGERRAADALLALGVAAAVPTALSGVADWADTEGPPRRYGLVHALLNSGALTLFVASLIARRSGGRSAGVGLSTAGWTLATLSAWVGGDLVFGMGTGVRRTAWAPSAPDFQRVARLSDLQPGVLARGELAADGATVPLVLLRTEGDAVLAIDGDCTHWGGPLWEGAVVGETCVRCPWHGSEFDLRDGHVVHGPAAHRARAYETRVSGEYVEARLVV